MTDGNSVASPPASPGFIPKYKLAEHRYGREEMLALFVPNSSVPDNLKRFPSVCVDKVQHPLAFVPLSDEEQVNFFVLLLRLSDWFLVDCEINNVLGLF